ncbi:hypothetical protein BJP36_05485 [Moorena producens JHB]|uniref:Fe2OG dioxygenase domain-containing protein n=2 Tax=Moorena producens TaxID=1155739 RepID=A0A1D9GA44_MOOP1|nr:hypothetical protein BJP36_05485 [Moorena producens JHB]OLT69126.1 hypothetical protein BI334_04895 [Moorena producens 3L]
MKTKRIPSKMKREFFRIPILHKLSYGNYLIRLENHSNSLPTLAPVDLPLLNSLKREGTFITSLEELAISSNKLRDSAEDILSKLRALPIPKIESSITYRNELINYPQILKWGLNERLLDIVENYLGLPVLLAGLIFQRNIADSKPVNVRQWHVDPEDYRMVKIIIYLNDVGLDGGPFEYIPRNLTSSLAEALNYNYYYSGLVSDKYMARVASKFTSNPCTGAYGTVIFTDTRNIFHRLKPPTASDRYSITFAYTSRRPITTFERINYSQKHLQAIASGLSQRQQDCLFLN